MFETQYFKQQDGSKIAYKILEPHNPEDIKNEIPLVLIIGFIRLPVIILDNRGMGESSVVSSDDPISLDLMAQDTIALIKHLGIKKFNLFGWSMGERQWEALKGIDIVSKSQMIKTTTLLLHDEADEMLPITEGEFIANAIPNLKFIRIPNAGHM
ncbi:44297_t:CDS:2 [Gigaspora margarita]|uniref:44297_t:CDS:1 n=1 Tax=Gigaspora margarita TaxID=4874 RepID=A0ABM8W333_GIGMA|nr:44297_t:CDS:2 [Gigaspora margarita]